MLSVGRCCARVVHDPTTPLPSLARQERHAVDRARVHRDHDALFPAAARDHRRIEVDYVSLNRPDREGRIIVPHTLVWTGLRWHVRGWCEKNQDYRDFVLSRFRGKPEILDASEHTADHDADWQLRVEVVIAPDPRLTAQQQEVVAHDFDMRDHRLTLRTRARLLPYLIKLLQIELNPEDRHPRAQQVIILNQKELTPWLLESI